MRNRFWRRLTVLVLLTSLALAACGDGGGGVEEEWQVGMMMFSTSEGFTDHGYWRLKPDNRIDGEWKYGSTAFPFTNGSSTLEGDAFSFTAKGVSKEPSFEFELKVTGNLQGGGAEGQYAINAPGDDSSLYSGHWSAVWVDGNGITIPVATQLSDYSGDYGDFTVLHPIAGPIYYSEFMKVSQSGGVMTVDLYVNPYTSLPSDDPVATVNGTIVGNIFKGTGEEPWEDMEVSIAFTDSPDDWVISIRYECTQDPNECAWLTVFSPQ